MSRGYRELELPLQKRSHHKLSKAKWESLWVSIHSVRSFIAPTHTAALRGLVGSDNSFLGVC